MQTKATTEQGGSSTPRVIATLARVDHDAANPPPASRRGTLSRARGRVLGALHGDKYLLPTEPPSW
jgi:hypothetical protein